MIVSPWHQLLRNVHENFLVNKPCRECGFQPVIRVLVIGIVFQFLCFLILIVLVVTRPDHNRRMMSEEFYILHRFTLHQIQKFLMCWIIPTSKKEVLPEENPHLVASFVELLFFKYTAAPSSKHDMVPVHRHFHPVTVPFTADRLGEGICRNPIATTAEDWDVVDLE